MNFNNVTQQNNFIYLQLMVHLKHEAAAKTKAVDVQKKNDKVLNIYNLLTRWSTYDYLGNWIFEAKKCNVSKKKSIQRRGRTDVVNI